MKIAKNKKSRDSLYSTILQLFVVKFLLLINNSSASNNIWTKPENNSANNFILHLLKNVYSHCTVLFFQDRYDNSDAVSYLASEMGSMNYFSVKYSFPSPDQIKKFVDSVKEFHLPSDSTNISSVLSSPVSLPFQFPVTVSNYHKRSNQCLISILMMKDIRSQFVSQVYNLLTPVYIPITRKDMDYYIFLTQAYLVEKLLLMKELPARIKYKLGVALSRSNNNINNKVLVKTVCFFCGHGGTPQLIQFPEEFSIKTDYFPDMVQNLNGKTLHVSCPYIRSRIESDPPWEGIGNARRGLWKNLFEEFLTVSSYCNEKPIQS